MLKLVVQKSEILSILKLINSGLRSSGRKTKSTVCELTITDNKITIAVPGAVFSAECEVKGAAKITLPFFYFFDIIQNINNSVIEMIIEEGQMSIGTLTVGVQTTFIKDDRILKTIDLPINYTEKYLILLKTGKYTKEELAFNKLTSIIEAAEKNLEKNIEKAYKLLNPYGISKSDIESLVNERLYKSKI